MNQRLQYILSEYQSKLDAIQRQEIYNCTQIKDILIGETKEQDKYITIQEYVGKRIEQFHKEKRQGNVKIYTYALSKILETIGNITLASITPVTIEKFNQKLQQQLGSSSQGIVLRTFRAIINNAIKEGYAKYEIHPFVYTKMPTSKVRQLDLTVDDFIKIRNLDVNDKKITIARDLFLLSFYLGGINLVDLLQVNLSGDKLTYIRHKTRNKKQGNKEVTFTIPEEVKPIINKYIQPNGKLNFGYKYSYDNFRSYMDSCLKKMGEYLKISTRICYYCARKTFSQFAFDLGIRLEIIEYCIGQSMKENRPIFNYVRTTQKQADKAIQRVIDYTNNPEAFTLDVMVG
jgi:integrase